MIKKLKGYLSQPVQIQMMLLDWTINAYNIRQWMQGLLLVRKHKDLLRPNAVLKDRHLGERCFILGNGPSLADVDLSRVAGEQTFVVNKFALHPEAEKANAKYYLCLDWKFGAGLWGTDFINRLEKAAPKAVCFMQSDGLEFCQRNTLLVGHPKHLVLPLQRFSASSTNVEGIDLCGAFPSGSNVILTAIATAIYLGFREIYLLGVDGNGLVLPGATHFYGKVNEHETQISFEYSLLSMLLTMREYRFLYEICERQEIKLRHINPSSVLTAIPQASWDDVQL